MEKLVTAQKRYHQKAAARLGVLKRSVSNWVQAAKREVDNAAGTTAMPPTVTKLQTEVARLHTERGGRTEVERNIAKKAQ